MKTLLIIFLGLYFCVASHANSGCRNIDGRNGVYLEFRCYRDNNYPVIFAAMTDRDTLNLEIKTLEDFITSIYVSNPNIPTTNHAYQKTYDEIFGMSEETYQLCSFFISDFGNEFLKTQTIKKIDLLSGERIEISYARIIGFFIEYNRDEFWHYTENSLGLWDKNFINKIVVPLSIISYSKADNVFFNIQHSLK